MENAIYPLLQENKTVDEISLKPTARYYKVDSISVSIDESRSYTVYNRKVAKINTDITFNRYVVIPVITKQLNSSIRYWVGMKFYKHINEKSSSETELDPSMKLFADECQGKIEDFNSNEIDHFEIVQPSRDKKYFLKAIETVANNFQYQDEVILLPQTGSYTI